MVNDNDNKIGCYINLESKHTFGDDEWTVFCNPDGTDTPRTELSVSVSESKKYAGHPIKAGHRVLSEVERTLKPSRRIGLDDTSFFGSHASSLKQYVRWQGLDPEHSCLSKIKHTEYFGEAKYTRERDGRWRDGGYVYCSFYFARDENPGDQSGVTVEEPGESGDNGTVQTTNGESSLGKLRLSVNSTLGGAKSAISSLGKRVTRSRSGSKSMSMSTHVEDQTRLLSSSVAASEALEPLR